MNKVNEVNVGRRLSPNIITAGGSKPTSLPCPFTRLLACTVYRKNDSCMENFEQNIILSDHSLHCRHGVENIHQGSSISVSISFSDILYQIRWLIESINQHLITSSWGVYRLTLMQSPNSILMEFSRSEIWKDSDRMESHHLFKACTPIIQQCVSGGIIRQYIFLKNLRIIEFFSRTGRTSTTLVAITTEPTQYYIEQEPLCSICAGLNAPVSV